jgi:hypothetical protein
MEGSEQLLRVAEGVAGEDDALVGAVEELAEDDRGVAGGAAGTFFGAAPHELGGGTLVTGPLREPSAEQREGGVAIVRFQPREISSFW